MRMSFRLRAAMPVRSGRDFRADRAVTMALGAILLENRLALRGIAMPIDLRHELIDDFLAVGIGQPAAAGKHFSSPLGERRIGKLRELLGLIERQVAGGDAIFFQTFNERRRPLRTAEQHGCRGRSAGVRQLIPTRGRFRRRRDAELLWATASNSPATNSGLLLGVMPSSNSFAVASSIPTVTNWPAASSRCSVSRFRVGDGGEQRLAHFAGSGLEFVARLPKFAEGDDLHPPARRRRRAVLSDWPSCRRKVPAVLTAGHPASKPLTVASATTGSPPASAVRMPPTGSRDGPRAKCSATTRTTSPSCGANFTSVFAPAAAVRNATSPLAAAVTTAIGIQRSA